ncbi:hypothetical protein GN244_ATG18828 [Phytophthora infestans]|uniref:BZIP domain-containing protein n=1 Tax=Phytophthora infestans TaxID=4787 RepID=A0A833WDD9_PHYIN|nr:hypothetical protein GN244_ATG18828 [Phytophthora infestans]KAF4138581.1 hypothetical protein GN958_ATG12229 [Phytophthora infestans]
MDRSVFCLPNSHFLSDSVIGSLTTHHTSPLSLQVRKVSSRFNNTSSSLAWKPHEQLHSAGWESMEDGENVSLLDRAQEPTEENDGSSLRQEDVKETAFPTDKENVREERRRKKRCEIQRRYRKRQAEHTSKLVTQVHRLRNDIKELQQKRGSMRAIVIVNRDVWNIALAYYARLRRVNNQDTSSSLKRRWHRMWLLMAGLGQTGWRRAGPFFSGSMMYKWIRRV